MKKCAIFILAFVILSSGCASMNKYEVGQQFQGKYLPELEVDAPKILHFSWGTLTLINHLEKETEEMTVMGEFKIDKGWDVYNPTLEYLIVDNNKTIVDRFYLATKSGKINKLFKFTKTFPYDSSFKYYQVLLRCSYS